METQGTDEEVLQDFLLDIECLDELSFWTSRFNLFDVLKISRTEIRHSNILAWLINANENHGFGDQFIKRIVQQIVENDEEGKYDIFQLLLLDFYNFTIYREWKNIDILIVSEKDKIAIAIENKVGAHEHSNQLNRYRKILEKDYHGYQRIFVFLTPDGEEPSDVENWSVLTYKDVLEILETIKDKVELLPDVELLIRNYMETLRRDIVEDQRLIEICNKIYSKHKKALDLIYENRIDGRNQITEILKNTLNEISDINDIRIEKSILSNRSIRFNTGFMDQYLKSLEETKGSWNTKEVYYYWFDIEENRFRVIFELGGLNVVGERMENMQKFINILKPTDKRKIDFKYKRLFSTKWYKIDDAKNIEEDIKEKSILVLKEIKKFEEKLQEQFV